MLRRSFINLHSSNNITTTRINLLSRNIMSSNSRLLPTCTTSFSKFMKPTSSTYTTATAPTLISSYRFKKSKAALEKEQQDSAYEEEGDAAIDESKLSVEEKEEMEDQRALTRYLKYGVFLIASVIAAYFANEHAKKVVGFKEKDSTYVHVNTRGRPSLGGPFVLVNTEGEVVSQADFLGKWQFFYFGFVHCPEICPIELNRMTKVVDMVKEKRPKDTLQPLFVSCDVKRDNLSAIKEYLSIFHKDFIGLVGTPNQVNTTCKSYRIYYSLPDDEGVESGDYLIDHSIAIFLFDPQGRFVDFFGSRYDHNEIAAKVVDYMGKYEADPEWTNY